MEKRALWVAGSLLVGFLQAWDSGALRVQPFAQALIAAGIFAPAAAIGLTEHFYSRLAALIGGAALLVWARMIAPISLNALHIGLFVPAMYILFVWRWEALRAAGSAR